MVDAVLYATGRVPNVNGLGLEDAGVAQGSDGAMRVDDSYQHHRALDLSRWAT